MVAISVGMHLSRQTGTPKNQVASLCRPALSFGAYFWVCLKPYTFGIRLDFQCAVLVFGRRSEEESKPNNTIPDPIKN